MSLLAESCAIRAEQQGDSAKAQQYRTQAQGYRRTTTSPRTSPRRSQPRQQGPRETPEVRYMSPAQARYLDDLISPRPEQERTLLHAALNAEWQARTLTTGRASAWITHLLRTPCTLVASPETTQVPVVLDSTQDAVSC